MPSSTQVIRIGVADDHALFRKSLVSLLEYSRPEFRVCMEASDGMELISLLEKLPAGELPGILLIDISMPRMDGFDTAAYLQQHFPAISVLIITMMDSEESLIRLLQFGVKGFLSKNTLPEELSTAIFSIVQHGSYYTDFVTGKLLSVIREEFPTHPPQLSSKELEFLRLSCTEMTYKEIAAKMFLSVKTIDTYRDHLFTRLGVKSRVGLVVYAIRKGLFNVHENANV